MKILIVDDQEVNLKTIGTFCKKQGCDVVTVQDGSEAVEQFSSYRPDLVLVGEMIPKMNGYEMTSKIKEISGDKWIPVILIIALEENEENLTEIISCGADDYLTKPVNLNLLGEKIKVMQRISTMQMALLDKCIELESYKEENKEEHLLAKRVMERIIRKVEIDEDLMQRWILPAKVFSADVVAAAMTPGDLLHVILADGTGHGLAAALYVMPVMETFYAMTQRGCSLSAIVEELNQKLKRLTPIERFVAATLVSIDWVERTIEVWNGGCPSSIFVVEEGTVQHTWNSNNLPLGILNSYEIDIKTDLFKWDEPGQLFLFSDGLVDAQDENQQMFGFERLLELFSKTSSSDRFKKLKAAVTNHFDHGINKDDVSLIEIRCPLRLEKQIHKRIQTFRPSLFTASRWRIDLCLESREIKEENCLPMLLAWLKQSEVSEWHCQRLDLILSELYYNAVEHGILKLDSSLKTLSHGFEVYLKKRAERLSVLEGGKIDIHIGRIREENGDFLYINIKDNGDGFDHHLYLDRNGVDDKEIYGRGINLVRGLSKEIKYLGNGSEVQVVYPLSQADKSQE